MGMAIIVNNDGLFGLISYLIFNKRLVSGALKAAFLATDRQHFVPPAFKKQAYADHPLAIGEGQTISQPSTVAVMLEALKVEKGHAVLDIGCGSGWTSALLGQLVGQEGSVTGLERRMKLLIQGRKNLSHFKLPHVQLYLAHDRLGYPENRFDRILVSASAPSFPEQLLNQLKPEGILVIPVQSDILICKKDKDENMRQESLSGFSFVPLIY